MTTTAGHSFYIGPIVFFYNQVNDTGSWEPQIFHWKQVKIIVQCWHFKMWYFLLFFLYYKFIKCQECNKNRQNVFSTTNYFAIPVFNEIFVQKWQYLEICNNFLPYPLSLILSFSSNIFNYLWTFVLYHSNILDKS
jgi:hypothetical protein